MTNYLNWSVNMWVNQLFNIWILKLNKLDFSWIALYMTRPCHCAFMLTFHNDEVFPSAATWTLRPPPDVMIKVTRSSLIRLVALHTPSEGNLQTGIRAAPAGQKAVPLLALIVLVDSCLGLAVGPVSSEAVERPGFHCTSCLPSSQWKSPVMWPAGFPPQLPQETFQEVGWGQRGGGGGALPLRMADTQETSESIRLSPEYVGALPEGRIFVLLRGRGVNQMVSFCGAKRFFLYCCIF